MYQDFNKTELKNLGNGLKRRILAHSDNLMTVYMEFDEVAIAETHSHNEHDYKVNLSLMLMENNIYAKQTAV